ncbi:MAG TPA: hypothetical protein VN720_03845 [Rudaea sp.]|nr:hypothetical protein [Rudaea sp.]
MASNCRSVLLALGMLIFATSNDANAIAVTVARDADVTFSVEMTNASSSDIPRAHFDSLVPLPWAWSEYTLTTLHSPLCSLGNSSVAGHAAIELSAGPIPAHSSVVCSIGVHRTASSLYALQLAFAPDTNSAAEATLIDAVWAIGPLADLSIAAHQVGPFPAPGQRNGLIKISVSNRGPLDVLDADFGYCQDTAAAPFVVNTDLPGGCAVASSGLYCFDTGGPSVQFGVGSLAANQTKSCLLQITANAPLFEPVSFPVSFAGAWQSADGEYPIDPDDSDNFSSLVLAPRSALPVPVGTPLLYLLVCFLLLVVARYKILR